MLDHPKELHLLEISLFDLVMIARIEKPESEHVITMDNYVKNSMNFKNTRTFNYQLNDKAAKSKLIKSAKRAPLEVEENTNSTNINFSLGSWYGIVLPTIQYWKEVGGEITCKIGDSTIKVIGLKAGTDVMNKYIDTCSYLMKKIA